MTDHNMIARLRKRIAEDRAECASGIGGEELEQAQRRVAKWERRLKREEAGSPRTRERRCAGW